MVTYIMSANQHLPSPEGMIIIQLIFRFLGGGGFSSLKFRTGITILKVPDPPCKAHFDTVFTEKLIASPLGTPRTASK